MKSIEMIVWLLVVVVGLYILYSSYLYFQQDRLIFIPMAEIEITPDEIGLEFEDVHIDVEEDVRLHAWYFGGNDSARTVLFCHGNAGNISHRLETARFLLQQGVNVLLFDYRGYGKSTGSPSEDGVYADALACQKWLVDNKELAPDNLVLFGRSLGGAVAVDLAGRIECAGVIVESAFTSAADMGRRMFPFTPIQFILRYDLNTAEKIGGLTVPVLICHSPEDDIIPFGMGEELYRRASEPKTFLELKGGHNDLAYMYDDSYIAAMGAMLDPGVEESE